MTLSRFRPAAASFLRGLLAAGAAALLAALPGAVRAEPTADASAQASAVVDRGRFTVEVIGQGPDVILIPGLASSRAVWDDLTAELARTHRVHRVQIAGFAGLPPGPNAEGPVVQPFVEALAAYIEEAGLERPAVIGHSMGGFSGLLLAQQRPELVSRLLIVDAAAFFSALGNPSATAESAKPGADRFKATVLGLSDQQFAAGQQGMASVMMKTAARRPLMVEWSVATDRRVMAQAAWEVMTTDARPGLPAMTTPTTVLYAFDESMSQPGRPVTPETMDGLWRAAYQGLPNANLVRIDGSYHFIMFDQPDRFRAEVERFLSPQEPRQ